MEKIKIKKINKEAKIPTHGSEYSAGYDLYACIPTETIVKPFSTLEVGTGLAIALPEGTFGAIYARSGLATREHLRPANCVGIIDSDYRGEIKIIIHNDSEEIQKITPGERVAQLVLQKYIPMSFQEVDELDETARGEGGFGSTGMN